MLSAFGNLLFEGMRSVWLRVADYLYPMVAWISGLGCDPSILSDLRVRSSLQMNLDYPELTNKAETLAEYALRLAEPICHRAEDTVLIGFSMGGILAIEIAKQLPVRRVVLIGSVKTRDELPGYMHNLRAIPVNRLVPPGLLKWMNQATADTVFGTRNAEESARLHKIISGVQPKFLAWAVNRIICWDNDFVPEGLVHIHGTDDNIFFSANIRRALWVEGGTHFLTVQHAVQVNRLLEQALADVI